MSHRASVLQLESDFADAMNRMYAVGNGLARLRSEIDHEDAVGLASRAVHRAPVAPLPVAPLPVATVPAATVPAATAATAGGPAPTAPATPGWTPPGPSTAPPSRVAPVAWYRREGAVT